MAIQIENNFQVRAPADRVWAFLTDLERVSACLGGSKITGKSEDDTYTGTMNVRLGPVSSTYEGTVRFVRTDSEVRVAELHASGRDSRGKGSAELTMLSELAESADVTKVAVKSSVRVTGVLARLGRGMINDVSDQIFAQFVSCMRAALETADRPPETVGAEQVGGSGGGDAGGDGSGVADEALDLAAVGARAARLGMRRVLRRPTTWMLLALLAVAAWLAMR